MPQILQKKRAIFQACGGKSRKGKTPFFAIKGRAFVSERKTAPVKEQREIKKSFNVNLMLKERKANILMKA